MLIETAKVPEVGTLVSRLRRSHPAAEDESAVNVTSDPVTLGLRLGAAELAVGPQRPRDGSSGFTPSWAKKSVATERRRQPVQGRHHLLSSQFVHGSGAAVRVDDIIGPGSGWRLHAAVSRYEGAHGLDMGVLESRSSATNGSPALAMIRLN